MWPILFLAAAQGCPTRLYDTLSNFSNQDEGGVLLFGVDEQQDFLKIGVYGAQDLTKHITEHCNQMSPVARPVFIILSKYNKTFVSAKIPGLDINDINQQASFAVFTEKPQVCRTLLVPYFCQPSFLFRVVTI